MSPRYVAYVGIGWVALAGAWYGYASADSVYPTRPDPSVTPGALNEAVTQETIGATICVRGWMKTIRPPVEYTEAIKRRLMAQPMYRGLRLRDAELDHDIPLELGGAPTDERNLWVEPYAGEWGARVKDRLENRLRELVCDGTVSLSDAQNAIRTDWIAAYKRYVGGR